MSDQEATEMISLAERIEEDVKGWLESCHPEFLQA